jgi:para-aminobenzoate synthetase/4-amino-4-deoxychorismate lyase
LSGGGSDLGASQLPRPDPAAGLYETVLVCDGAPRDLDPHLARLAASFGALYGRAAPDDLAARAAAAAAAAGHEHARLRIDVTPDGAAAVTVTALGPPAPVTLRPVVVPGGLGPHKWRDRRLLEALEQEDPDTMPLLLGADGHVLEASRASVAVQAADGRLYTPPRDGRILPGVTVALARAAERPLTLPDLRAAPALYVASALRGLQPAALSPAARTPAG